MKILTKYPLLFLLILTGCTTSNNQKSLENNDIDPSIVERKSSETIVIQDKCNKSTINNYLTNGWSIETTETKQIPCKWKKVKARPKCNPKTDKGCMITVPASYGNLTIYKLKREVQSMN